MRWPMQANRAPTRSQRASSIIAALPVIATTFAMHAIVGCRSRQLKMPRPDAYGARVECEHGSRLAQATARLALGHELHHLAQHVDVGSLWSTQR